MDKRIFIELEHGSTKIQRTLFRPFEPIDGKVKTEEELLEEGYLIERPAAPEYRPGKTAQEHYSPERGFWYEYVDPILPPDVAQVAELKKQIETMQEALDFMIMNGGV